MPIIHGKPASCGDCNGTDPVCRCCRYGVDADGNALKAPECEDCDTTQAVSDWRSPYDPTPGPLPLCDNCATSRAERQAGAY